MPFVISGLDPASFLPLYGVSDAVLAAAGARRLMVDDHPGAPDRIELNDVPAGKTVLLLNYEHQAAPTPYRSRHAIFVREGATKAARFENAVPAALRIRTLSLRAFDAGHEMIDADLVEGTELPHLAERMLADPRAAYLHAHYARRGCYAARIDRL